MATMKRWVLRRRPVGDIQPGDLDYIEEPIRDLQDGEILVRVVYLSLDPTNRIWMSDQDQYMPPVVIGDTMRGGTMGVVEQSRSDLYRPGDVVNCLGNWASHAIVDARSASPLTPPPGLPITALLSVLGGTGQTAWWGLHDIGQPKAGETVVVSAAAGAVGSVVVQLAKLKGCRVIGIAGGREKCDWLVNELGIDGAVDYKNEDVGAALDRLCPNGIDVNFENVGGAIMDAVVNRMNDFARMPLCGMISGYHSEGNFSGPTDFGRVLMHRLRIQGFILTDYYPRMQECMDDLVPLVREGKIKWRVHIDRGLENAPQSLERLFSGDHQGKLLVQVSDYDES